LKYCNCENKYFKCKYLKHKSRGSKYTLAQYLGLNGIFNYKINELAHNTLIFTQEFLRIEIDEAAFPIANQSIFSKPFAEYFFALNDLTFLYFIFIDDVL